MEKVFVNAENKLPAAGIHALNFYSLGVPATVVIDDKLPMKNKKEVLFGK